MPVSESQTENNTASGAATETEILNLGALQLLGVMHAQDGMAALLRSPRGQIARVAVGEEAFGVRVTAIGDTGVIISDSRGQSDALVLPQS